MFDVDEIQSAFEGRLEELRLLFAALVTYPNAKFASSVERVDLGQYLATTCLELARDTEQMPDEVVDAILSSIPANTANHLDKITYAGGAECVGFHIEAWRVRYAQAK